MSKEKIERLRERIRQLMEVNNEDIRESYRETTQTQLTIEAHEKHLANLENEMTEDITGVIVSLKNKNTTRTFTIIPTNPNPSQGIITSNSPLGKKLLELEVGDKVNIGEHEFTIHSKGPYNHNFDK